MYSFNPTQISSLTTGILYIVYMYLVCWQYMHGHQYKSNNSILQNQQYWPQYQSNKKVNQIVFLLDMDMTITINGNIYRYWLSFMLCIFINMIIMVRTITKIQVWMKYTCILSVFTFIYSPWNVPLSYFLYVRHVVMVCSSCIHLRSPFRSVRAHLSHYAIMHSPCVHASFSIHFSFRPFSFIYIQNINSKVNGSVFASQNKET